MHPQAGRVLLGLVAVVTLALTVGGTLGAWPVGAPALRGDSAAATGVLTRDMEGASGDVRRGTTDGQGSPARVPRSLTRVPGPSDQAGRGQTGTDQASPDQAGSDSGDPSSTSGRPDSASSSGAQPSTVPPVPPVPPALPARSGTGRRVVFDMSDQRVWLVGRADRVRRTYPVSGSKLDNLDTGRYEVYSRSRHAISYTYEETMDFMVRFAHGDNAAIGFHDIPVDRRGRPVQTREQLGQPLSSGCIRQARPDAVALWKFADLGTRVVVVS